MSLPALLQPTDISWEDRPTGGSLQLRAIYPSGAAIQLEMVFAHGRPFWFLHVLNVPFEIQAGIA